MRSLFEGGRTCRYGFLSLERVRVRRLRRENFHAPVFLDKAHRRLQEGDGQPVGSYGAGHRGVRFGLERAARQHESLLSRIQPLLRPTGDIQLRRGFVRRQRRQIFFPFPRGVGVLPHDGLDSRRNPLPRLDDGADSRLSEHDAQAVRARAHRDGFHNPQSAASGGVRQGRSRIRGLAVERVPSRLVRVVRKPQYDEGGALQFDENHHRKPHLRLRNQDGRIRLRARPDSAFPRGRLNRNRQRGRYAGVESRDRQIHCKELRRRKNVGQNRVQKGTPETSRIGRGQKQAAFRRGLAPVRPKGA